jgi:hypothetical protein
MGSPFNPEPIMKKSAILVLLGALLFNASPAYAYIDPGTGGVLAQLLTGGVAGLMVIARLYGHKIRAALGFSAGKQPSGSSDATPADARE